jgi:hypothetical protein
MNAAQLIACHNASTPKVLKSEIGGIEPPTVNAAFVEIWKPYAKSQRGMNASSGNTTTGSAKLLARARRRSIKLRHRSTL